MIEQLNVLRDETKGIEMLLDRAQSQDRDIISKLYTFNRMTEIMEEKLIYEEEEILKNTNNFKKVASIVSVILKTDIAISKIERQIHEIYSILHVLAAAWPLDGPP